MPPLLTRCPSCREVVLVDDANLADKRWSRRPELPVDDLLPAGAAGFVPGANLLVPSLSGPPA
jgi:hypothetical protein